MDKNAIKKYAVWARNELIARVTQKAQQYGITADDIVDAKADSINGNLLTTTEKKQRQALIKKIEVEGFEQVMEEVAYTWFNRFTALRFMEVNNYLPSHIRVFTNDDNEFKPQILSEAINLELDGLDMDKVFELKDANKDEELYKYLLIVQCNALNEILPRMFQKIEDYTELLLPDYLLREGSIIEQMISIIPENNWTEQVQIIGWLYQYYNKEKKDKVFSELKKNVKITKENIPAATQLFTPDWIVRYMVENSLGRYWIERHNNVKVNDTWEYYIDEDIQDDVVEEQLLSIREKTNIKPEEIKCIDPCSGSGHILCYMFDVLIQIYEIYGYSSQEAASSIVDNNIFGLDIDERASQLAYFSVMMKGRQYGGRRFFSKKHHPNVYSIKESNRITDSVVNYYCNNDEELEKDIRDIVSEMYDAKEYGSILKVKKHNWEKIKNRFDEISDEISMFSFQTMEELKPVIEVASVIAGKYDVLVTNPPYMSNKGMSPKLAKYVQENYQAGKTDMYAVFMLASDNYCKRDSIKAMITQHSWMFLSSQEDLRISMMHQRLINMIHLGARAFDEISGEVVQTTAFVWSPSRIRNYRSSFVRLIKYLGEEEKRIAFLKNDDYFSVSTDELLEIPSAPCAYWLSNNALGILKNSKLFDQVSTTRAGMITGNNNKFVRMWFEVSSEKSNYISESREDAIQSGAKWFPYSKGGEFRKWYGNNDCVVNWYNDGFEMRNFKDDKGTIPAHAFNLEYIFKTNVCWNSLSSKKFSARYTEKGFLYDAGGSFASLPKTTAKYYLGFLNSSVAFYYLSALNPTMNFQKGNVGNLPIIVGKQEQIDAVEAIVNECLNISKEDWDSFEYSWDFEKHPFVGNYTKIEDAYLEWEKKCSQRFEKLKELETKLNELFIEIYDLKTEVIPDVYEDEITVRKAVLERDIKGFISYAVGCMFGRFSLSKPGVICANHEIDKYNREGYYEVFQPDLDNIIPICNDEYFSDDIVARFVEFVKIVFGEQNIEENLSYIANALGGNGNPQECIRSYFMSDFYKDHCSMYSGTMGKRPIYWLFDSGKKNGFKCLIYVHRYKADTIARIRTDYVHEMQSRYRTEIIEQEKKHEAASTGDKVKINKKLKVLREQNDEIAKYEEKMHHLADQMIDIDLDDGVKVNYAKFQDVLAKIK